MYSRASIAIFSWESVQVNNRLSKGVISTLTTSQAAAHHIQVGMEVCTSMKDFKEKSSV